MLFKKYYHLKNLIKTHRNYLQTRSCCSAPKTEKSITICVQGATYETDEWTNVTNKILSLVGRNLHLQKNHPLNLIHQRIVHYFYKAFSNTKGNPLFSVHNNLKSVVSVEQNFDSLLIPKDHPSRAKSDCYYVNKNYLLRAHTTAHQAELVNMGLNDFLIVGDVYRRDEVDSTHYPVFHQVDGVRLRTRDELFSSDESLKLFETEPNSPNIVEFKKQDCHTLEAVKLMEHELKATLMGLARQLFGQDVKARWVTTDFPFTEPSWELEVYNKDKWLEVLGCGIMRQEILRQAGAHDRIGWAFGLGLERLAMRLYQIPDIRLFWSTDTGFLKQFDVPSADKAITYRPISVYPQCHNDLSFWLPKSGGRMYVSNDFYDLVRSLGGDMVEQVTLVDEFKHPKTGLVSHCYRITYRHMERTLTQAEVNVVHEKIAQAAAEQLAVLVR